MFIVRPLGAAIEGRKSVAFFGINGEEALAVAINHRHSDHIVHSDAPSRRQSVIAVKGSFHDH